MHVWNLAEPPSFVKHFPKYVPPFALNSPVTESKLKYCSGLSLLHGMLRKRLPSSSLCKQHHVILHGEGQRIGNSGTYWTFISVPLTEIVEENTQGCDWKTHVRVRRCKKILHE